MTREVRGQRSEVRGQRSEVRIVKNPPKKGLKAVPRSHEKGAVK